jgi:hypothetical protein
MTVTRFVRDFHNDMVNASGSQWRKFKESGVMAIYRSPMEKILEQQEENAVITVPKEPMKTFFRKLAYTYDRWKEKIKRRCRGIS